MTDQPAADYLLLFQFIIYIGSDGDRLLGGMRKIIRAQKKRSAEGSNTGETSILDKKYELVWGLEEDTMKGVGEGFLWYTRG